MTFLLIEDVDRLSRLSGGRLEYVEENDPAERHPGYGGECADDMD